MSARDSVYRRVDTFELDADPRELARRLGCPEDDLPEGIAQAWEEVASVARCAYISRTAPVLREGDKLLLLGRDIGIRSAEKWLKGAGRVRLLALTLGFGVERLLKNPSLGLSRRFLLDACASAMAESLAELAEREFFGSSPHGKRFSPGYGGMPVELSRDIVAYLSAQNNLGISFTEAHAMLPTKSITAIIPIWED